jgi:hypothetical protein
LEQPEVVSTIFGWYRAYTDGFLPFGGAITDQPNNLVIAFQEISLIKGILDAEDAEKAKDGNDNVGNGFKSVLNKKG